MAIRAATVSFCSRTFGRRLMFQRLGTEFFFFLVHRMARPATKSGCEKTSPLTRSGGVLIIAARFWVLQGELPGLCPKRDRRSRPELCAGKIPTVKKCVNEPARFGTL